MSELKSCPFCGRQPTSSGNWASCESVECDVLANGHVDDWNQRPIEDALRERAEKAEAEVGWLIENIMSGSPRWWTGKRRAESPYCWTANAADAVRFCRESDAQRVIEWACWGDSKHIFPTEHRWG